MVKTRNQIKNEHELSITTLHKKNINQLYEVKIDFDEASKAWLANKKSLCNGYYKYVCNVEKNKLICGKSCYKELTCCWIHRNFNKTLCK